MRLVMANLKGFIFSFCDHWMASYCGSTFCRKYNFFKIISLTSIDGKLFVFYVLETFNSNFLSIGARDINLPPLDASGYGESKKLDRKSTRLNSSHQIISYAVFCLK